MAISRMICEQCIRRHYSAAFHSRLLTGVLFREYWRAQMIFNCPASSYPHPITKGIPLDCKYYLEQTLKESCPPCITTS